MTLLNYTDPIPTPAPVTSGTTIQTYQDPTGEWWVAKNGVNGGNWNKARDVLYGRVYRTAALTMPTTAANVPWNVLYQDLYGMWNNTSFFFTVPIAGLWQMDAQICIAFTAAMQFVGFQSVSVRTNVYAPGACNTYAQIHDTFPLAAAQSVGITGYTNVALAMAGLNASDSYYTIKYVGTG